MVFEMKVRKGTDRRTVVLRLGQADEYLQDLMIASLRAEWEQAGWTIISWEVGDAVSSEDHKEAGQGEELDLRRVRAEVA
jgi:hypothetical protein